MSRSISKLLIVAVVLIAAFFLYRYLFVTPDEGLDTPGLEAVGGLGDLSGPGAVADDEFIRLLERLQGVELNSDLFTSPAWNSLVNFRVELVPEDKGRRNPFAPTGFDPAASTTATSSRPR